MLATEPMIGQDTKAIHTSYKAPLAIIAILIYTLATIIISLHQIVIRHSNTDDIDHFNYPNTISIFDRHGRHIYDIYESENRFPVSLSDVSPHLVHAIIATEDQTYYSHHGFSPKAIIRATIHNITQDTLQGGSTITQQLVKNKLLSNTKSIARKVEEIYLSFVLETQYTKDQILEMYLNQINFGGVIHGVESASQTYFGKSARDLDLRESIFLASLPQAPSRYMLSDSSQIDHQNRQQNIAFKMYSLGYIDKNSYSHLVSSPLYTQKMVRGIQAPHFVDFLRPQISELTRHNTQTGYRLITTLDLDIQAHLETILSEEMAKLHKYKISNGAILVMKPQSGEIIAMIGSTDYFSQQIDGQVNVVTSQRQPGSAIKPIIYALALDRDNLKPWHIILDNQIFIPDNNRYWIPRNYDNKFHGSVTIRQALANSYNIPAIKVAQQAGIINFINFANQMGLRSYNHQTPIVPSLALGSWETSMIDLASAYSTFANDGYRTTPISILGITNSESERLALSHCNLSQIASLDTSFIDNNCGLKTISSETSFYINSILSDPQARSQAFGQNSILNIPNHQVAVKTGTSNNMRDNWAIGYTADWLVAVWVGNNDGSPMSHVASGITGASPIWSRSMTYLLSNSKTPQVFSPPQSLRQVELCLQITSDGICTHKQLEYLNPDTVPTARTLH
jgi:penicillin-binding protein 1C